MSDEPDIETEVYRLAAEGRSVREIASLTGVPKSTAGRWLAARREVGVEYADTDTDDDDLVSMVDAMDARAVDSDAVVEPITYTGLKPVSTPIKGIDVGPPVMMMTYTDAVGHELDDLSLYRYRQWLEGQRKWAESERTIDAQCAQDDGLEWTTDMCGGTGCYLPKARQTDAVDRRWTVGPPS